ncbi:MAG TPA: hypothetical protein VGN17_12290 [Bryobacteraceae bacterium]|jgi:hypothetical protein
MATERQILANRANALKSTGPRTGAGKQRSSQNAAVHSLVSTTVLLKGESLHRFNELASALVLQFSPRNSAESFLVHTLLVQTMIAARWRLLRLWGMQTAGFQLEMARTAEFHPGLGAGAPLAAVTSQSLADHSRALALQHRLEVSYFREFNQALSQLQKLRARPDSSGPDPDIQLDTETWEPEIRIEANAPPPSPRASDSE